MFGFENEVCRFSDSFTQPMKVKLWKYVFLTIFFYNNLVYVNSVDHIKGQKKVLSGNHSFIYIHVCNFSVVLFI